MSIADHQNLSWSGLPYQVTEQERRVQGESLVTTLTELQSCSVMGEPDRWTTVFAAVHHSCLYGWVARQKPVLSKRHFIQIRQNCLNAKCSIWKPSIANHLANIIPMVKLDGGNLMLWECFSMAETRILVRTEGMARGVKYRKYAPDCPWPERRVTSQHDNAIVASGPVSGCPWVIQLLTLQKICKFEALSLLTDPSNNLNPFAKLMSCHYRVFCVCVRADN